MRSASPRLGTLRAIACFAALLVYIAPSLSGQAAPSPVSPEPAPPSQPTSSSQQEQSPGIDPATGKPITSTLTYTVDPVTGERVPVNPEPPPTKAERKAARVARHPAFDDRHHIGVMADIGTSGAGIQIGVPLIPHVALRVGGDYIRYTGDYTYDAANVHASLQFGYARAALDFFPWRERRFHISPFVVVANQTHVQATVTVQPNTTFDLGGNTFYGSAIDPLHGVGRVDLRKTSPGISIGFGNLTHGRGHWTFPVEMGAFYNGQPKLQIDFTGTACVAGQPPQFACQPVQNNPDFQGALQKFRDRQVHNLSYAQWIPVFNFGVGYRF